MSHYFYISPEEYEIAERNGIGREILRHRIQYLSWTKERAITTPVRKRNMSKVPWRELAEKNGINRSTFHARIQCGWDVEKASTTPVKTMREKIEFLMDMNEKRRKYPSEILKEMKRNDICYSTFCKRVKRGIDLETAATVSPWSLSAKGMR